MQGHSGPLRADQGTGQRTIQLRRSVRLLDGRVGHNFGLVGSGV